MTVAPLAPHAAPLRTQDAPARLPQVSRSAPAGAISSFSGLACHLGVMATGSVLSVRSLGLLPVLGLLALYSAVMRPWRPAPAVTSRLTADLLRPVALTAAVLAGSEVATLPTVNLLNVMKGGLPRWQPSVVIRPASEGGPWSSCFM